METSAKHTLSQSLRHQSPNKKRDIAWAFVIIFFPMLIAGLALCVLVLGLRRHVSHRNGSSDEPSLPVNNKLRQDSYYTRTDPWKLLLASGWASTIAGWTMAPFILLYTFLIARKFAPAMIDPHSAENFNQLQAIIGGSWLETLHWAMYSKKIIKKSFPLVQATNIAALRVIFSTLL